MSAFAGIERAALLIALDNGGINRERSEHKFRKDFARWIERQPQEPLPAIDAYLAGLSDEELNIVCCGGAGEPETEALLQRSPPFTDGLLNGYFEQVC